MRICSGRKAHSFENGITKCIMEFRCDTASDLPSPDDEPSMLIGSVAWVISGDGQGAYMLDSSGAWVRQDESV